MPDIPSALPDKVKIRALIRERGYRITDIARKIGCPPSSIYDITGRNTPLPRGVWLLRQLAQVLSTPKRPVKVSDISDWTGDDDIEPEPETADALSA
jgi:hypothetical protein